MQTEANSAGGDNKVDTPEPLLTNKDCNDDKNKAKAIVAPQNGSSLSRVEMLKLLEQVQISTPLESVVQNRHRNTDQLARSNLETLLFGDS